jgi:hypothetical protein
VPTGKNTASSVGTNEPGAKFLGKIQTDELFRAAQAALAAR